MTPLEQVERLHALHRAGALTDEEFIREKENVLASPTTPIVEEPDAYRAQTQRLSLFIIGISAVAIVALILFVAWTKFAGGDDRLANSSDVAGVNSSRDATSSADINHPTSGVASAAPLLTRRYLIGSWNPDADRSGFDCDVSDIVLRLGSDGTFDRLESNENVFGKFRLTPTGVTLFDRQAPGIDQVENRPDIKITIKPVSHRFALIDGQRYYRCATVTGD